MLVSQLAAVLKANNIWLPNGSVGTTAEAARIPEGSALNWPSETPPRLTNTVSLDAQPLPEIENVAPTAEPPEGEALMVHTRGGGGGGVAMMRNRKLDSHVAALLNANKV